MKTDIGAKPLLFPTPVLVVATYDALGNPNAMAVAWGGICCTEPPCATISVRKSRHTYGNLMATKAYTINVPSKRYLREADYFGISSGRDEDKIAVAGLTPIRSTFVNAPYINEFPLHLECKVVHVLDLGIHTQFVGEIVNVKADSALLENEGQPMIEKIMPLIFAPGSKNYYTISDEMGVAYSSGKMITRHEK